MTRRPWFFSVLARTLFCVSVLSFDRSQTIILVGDVGSFLVAFVEAINRRGFSTHCASRDGGGRSTLVKRPLIFLFASPPPD